MVTYGDGVIDLDVNALLAFHRSHGKLATVTAVRPPSRFGRLGLGSETAVSEVSAFAEKPQLDSWVSAGFFVFQREVFEYIDSQVNTSLEDKPLERLAEDGQLMAFKHPGFFFAMDTYREYLALNELWDANEAPWRIWDKQ